MMDDDTSPGDFVFRKGADGNLEGYVVAFDDVTFYESL